MSEPVEAVSNTLWAPFHDAAWEGRLVLPHCVETGRTFWPPSATSPWTTGGQVDWRPVASEGRLVARAVYRRGFQQAFAPLLPYGVGLVELEGGVRLQVHVSDPDVPASPQPGASVRLEFRPLFEGARPVLCLAKEP